MGFQLPQRTARLVFENEFKGAEVRVTLDQPLGLLIEAQKLQESQDLEKLIDFLAGILLGWNLEDARGKPIPATAQGLRQVTPAFVDALVDAWIKAQTGPTPEKKGKSRRGRA